MLDQIREVGSMKPGSVAQKRLAVAALERIDDFSDNRRVEMRLHRRRAIDRCCRCFRHYRPPGGHGHSGPMADAPGNLAEIGLLR